jgi:ankyrin repeat protein
VGRGSRGEKVLLAGSTTATLQLLLEKGADINTKDSTGKAPLIHAAKRGLKGLVELLLEKGAEIEAQDGKGWTALDWAQSVDASRVVSLLREKGARNVKR